MRKILLVDDENELLNIMSEALRMENFETITARNGSEALDILRRDKNIQAVFCDLTMPEMDGRAVLREMLLNYSHIPVAVVTAHFESETIVDILRLGAVDYLIKPVPLDLLIEKSYILCELGEYRSRAQSSDLAIDRRTAVRKEALYRLQNAKKIAG